MTKSRRTPTQARSTRAPAKPARKTAALQAKAEAKPKAKSPDLVPCTDCGKCCTYVAIEIESPTTAKNATMMLWYLYHENISLYREHDGDWVVQFETRCKHLGADNRCGVYSVRPHICREFDEKYCEVNTGDDGETFRTAAAFLEHLRVHRPRVHAKVAAGYARPADLAGPTSPRRKLPIVSSLASLS